MKDSGTIKQLFLNPEAIDTVADAIEEICQERKFDRKNSARVRLSVEESLSVWMKELGEGSPVTFSFGTKLTKPFFQISVEGNACNPYSVDADGFTVSGKSMLVSIGLIPMYVYRNGQNCLTFTINRRKLNPVVSLLIIIASALAVGILGKLLIPADVLSILNGQIITPIDDTVFKVLKAIAGPMIFLSVAWGVYGIGDVYTLGRIGKKMMISFITAVFCFSLFGLVFFPFFGKELTESTTQVNQFGQVFEMLLGIFPDNVFSPFIDGNTLQIIFLAFIIGLSMIFLGQRTAAIAKAVEQINHIINFLMGFISNLVPYFVFIVLVQIIWSSETDTLLSVWKFAAIFLVAYVVMNFGLLLFTGIKNKRNPFSLIKDCLPSYVIALTTASSAATFESNMSVCRHKLKIDSALASFGIPFGMVLFKPNSAMYYLLFCFYVTTVYDVKVSVSWLFIAVIISAVCAVATPPIPGGAAATYTMLFLQLGIPSQAVAVALAVDIIFDFFITSGDMLCLLLEMFNISGKLGMRSKE